MTGVVTVVSLALALVTAVLAGVDALRHRRVSTVDLAATGATELAVLVYVVVRIVDLVGGHHTSGLAVVIAYLFAIALTLPVAAALAVAEPSRWGSVTLAVGALVVCVLFARINQLWTPHG